MSLSRVNTDIHGNLLRHTVNNYGGKLKNREKKEHDIKLEKRKKSFCVVPLHRLFLLGVSVCHGEFKLHIPPRSCPS